MGAGESLFEQLMGQREAQRQYSFDFMPPVRGGGPYSVSLETAGATIYVVAADFGRHGLMLQSIRLIGSPDPEAGNPADAVMRLVEKIVVDVPCPYGPIKCIENDESLTGALLRTDPTSDGRYFEIVVEGDGVVDLTHYEIAGAARERRQTAVNLSRRVFVQMTDGLAEAFRCAEPVS
jgi:hypothetical protein